ncbi:hypothetical protein [Acidianus sp. HS-5]|uniref:hypothetical protein n=1 Tax=Acidianus sp. HS-5 TaxID=2886040 RepID=UPI001F44AE03|nr:hypothetical protein [Acidianus sp. HS-5]BDC17296.1 hypothetical protein HS5_01860 [Acidianus sp. HS-5]
MNLRIGELVALVIILGALSIGFLGDNQAANLSYPSLSMVDHYTGTTWKICNSYVGIAKESHFTCLYKLGNYPVAFANYTDSGGDILYVTEIVFPNSQVAHSYMLSAAPSSVTSANNGYVSTYISGYTEIVYLQHGNRVIEISFIGSSGLLPSTTSLEDLAIAVLG